MYGDNIPFTTGDMVTVYGLPCQRMISGIFVGIEHQKNWVDMFFYEAKHIRAFLKKPLNQLEHV